ncbi:MAG: hypothetical protein AAF662_10625 [Pseudomonadota bacterium]
MLAVIDQDPATVGGVRAEQDGLEVLVANIHFRAVAGARPRS